MRGGGSMDYDSRRGSGGGGGGAPDQRRGRGGGRDAPYGREAGEREHAVAAAAEHHARMHHAGMPPLPPFGMPPLPGMPPFPPHGAFPFPPPPFPPPPGFPFGLTNPLDSARDRERDREREQRDRDRDRDREPIGRGERERENNVNNSSARDHPRDARDPHPHPRDHPVASVNSSRDRPPPQDRHHDPLPPPSPWSSSAPPAPGIDREERRGDRDRPSGPPERERIIPDRDRDRDRMSGQPPTPTSSASAILPSPRAPPSVVPRPGAGSDRINMSDRDRERDRNERDNPPSRSERGPVDLRGERTIITTDRDRERDRPPPSNDRDRPPPPRESDRSTPGPPINIRGSAGGASSGPSSAVNSRRGSFVPTSSGSSGPSGWRGGDRPIERPGERPSERLSDRMSDREREPRGGPLISPHGMPMMIPPLSLTPMMMPPPLGFRGYSQPPLSSAGGSGIDRAPLRDDRSRSRSPSSASSRSADEPGRVSSRESSRPSSRTSSPPPHPTNNRPSIMQRGPPGQQHPHPRQRDRSETPSPPRVGRRRSISPPSRPASRSRSRSPSIVRESVHEQREKDRIRAERQKEYEASSSASAAPFSLSHNQSTGFYPPPPQSSSSSDIRGSRGFDPRGNDPRGSDRNAPPPLLNNNNRMPPPRGAPVLHQPPPPMHSSSNLPSPSSSNHLLQQQSSSKNPRMYMMGPNSNSNNNNNNNNNSSNKLRDVRDVRERDDEPPPKRDPLLSPATTSLLPPPRNSGGFISTSPNAIPPLADHGLTSPLMRGGIGIGRYPPPTPQQLPLPPPPAHPSPAPTPSAVSSRWFTPPTSHPDEDIRMNDRDPRDRDVRDREPPPRDARDRYDGTSLYRPPPIQPPLNKWTTSNGPVSGIPLPPMPLHPHHFENTTLLRSKTEPDDLHSHSAQPPPLPPLPHHLGAHAFFPSMQHSPILPTPPLPASQRNKFGIGLTSLERMKTTDEDMLSMRGSSSTSVNNDHDEQPTPTPSSTLPPPVPASRSPKGASRFFDSLSVHIPSKVPSTPALTKNASGTTTAAALQSPSIIPPSALQHDPTKKLLFHGSSPAASPLASPPLDRYDSANGEFATTRRLQYEGYPAASPEVATPAPTVPSAFPSFVAKSNTSIIDVDDQKSDADDADDDAAAADSSSEEEDAPELPRHMLAMSKAAILRAIKQIDEDVSANEERRDRLRTDIQEAARQSAKVAKQLAEAAEKEARAKQAREKLAAAAILKAEADAQLRAASASMTSGGSAAPLIVPEPVIDTQAMQDIEEAKLLEETQLSPPTTLDGRDVSQGPDPLQQHVEHRLSVWYQSPRITKQLEGVDQFRILVENRMRAKQAHEYVSTPYEPTLHKQLQVELRASRDHRASHHHLELTPAALAQKRWKQLNEQPFGLEDLQPYVMIQINVASNGEASIDVQLIVEEEGRMHEVERLMRTAQLSHSSHHHDYPAWLTTRNLPPTSTALVPQHSHIIPRHPPRFGGSGSGTSRKSRSTHAHHAHDAQSAAQSNVLLSLHAKLKVLRLAHTDHDESTNKQSRLLTDELVKLTHPSNPSNINNENDTTTMVNRSELFNVPHEWYLEDDRLYDKKAHQHHEFDDPHAPLYTDPRQAELYRENFQSFALKRNRVTAVVRAHRRATHEYCVQLAAQYKELERKWLHRHHSLLQAQHAQLHGASAPMTATKSVEGSPTTDGRRSTLRSRQVSDGMASPPPVPPSTSAWASNEENFQENLSYYNSLTSSSSSSMLNPHLIEATPASTLPPDEEQKRARYLRCTATLPDLIVDPRERKALAFDSRNGLVLDPAAEERAYKQRNPWTEAEKRIFERRFLKHPKQFRKIASFLPNKNVNECVAYYYYSKLGLNYKKLLRAQIRKSKKGGAQPNSASMTGGQDADDDSGVGFDPHHDSEELAHANNPYAQSSHYMLGSNKPRRGGLALMAPPLTGEEVLAQFNAEQEAAREKAEAAAAAAAAAGLTPEIDLYQRPMMVQKKPAKPRGMRELHGLAVNMEAMLGQQPGQPPPSALQTPSMNRGISSSVSITAIPAPTTPTLAAKSEPMSLPPVAPSSASGANKKRPSMLPQGPSTTDIKIEPTASPVPVLVQVSPPTGSPVKPAAVSRVPATPSTPITKEHSESKSSAIKKLDVDSAASSTSASTTSASAISVAAPPASKGQKREREKETPSKKKETPSSSSKKDASMTTSSDDESSVASDSESSSVQNRRKKAKKENSYEKDKTPQATPARGKKRDRADLSDVDEESNDEKEKKRKPKSGSGKEKEKTKEKEKEKDKQPKKKQKLAAKPLGISKSKTKETSSKRAAASSSSESSSGSESSSEDDEEDTKSVKSTVTKASSSAADKMDTDDDEATSSDETESDSDSERSTTSSRASKSTKSAKSKGANKASSSKDKNKDKPRIKKPRSEDSVAVTWSQSERDAFMNALEQHGKNWSALAQVIGSKSVDKCKNFFNNNKTKLKLMERVEKYEKNKSLALLQKQREKSGDAHAATSKPAAAAPSSSSATPAAAAAASSSSSSASQPVKSKLSEPKPATAATKSTESSSASSSTSTPAKPAAAASASSSSSSSVPPKEAAKPPHSGSATPSKPDKPKLMTLAEKEKMKAQSADKSNGRANGANAKSDSTIKKKLVVAARESSSSESEEESDEESDESSSSSSSSEDDGPPPVPMSRDDPMSWTNNEKQQLFRAIQIYGKQWDRITSMVGSRTQKQVEGFYKKFKVKLNLAEMVRQAEDMKQSPNKQRRR